MTDSEIKKLWDAWDSDEMDERAFGVEDIKKIPQVAWSIWPTANQWKNKETKSACTMVWAISQIQRLFQLQMSMEERNKLDIEIVNWAVKNKWYIIWAWWDSRLACASVCEWWNTYWSERYWTEKVAYFRVLWNNASVMKALDAWHLVWYTKKIQFWTDQVEGYVYRDKYPKTTWHRLNLKWAQLTIATWWAKRQDSKYWSRDNYRWQIWEEFFIKDLKPYINNWIYAYVYIILPVSALQEDIEDTKQKIAETKATNALIWVMTTTWADVPEKYQKMSADYAAELRKDYKWARPIYEDQEHKAMQSTVDMLSYSYKYANPKFQSKFAELAAELRKEYWLQ